MATGSSRENAGRPFFIPQGVEFDKLTGEMKAAIQGIINPAYRQLVLESRDGLEKSIGVTIVHLLWLEILDQVELGQDFSTSSPRQMSAERMKLIDRHLRVVNAKSKASNFLVRFQELQRKWGLDFTLQEPFPEMGEPLEGWQDTQTGG